MKTDDYESKNVLGDAIYKVEPVPADFRDVEFKITLNRYAAATLQDWKENGTDLQGDLTFTGAANSMLIQLPHLEIYSGFDANVEGPAPLTQTGVLKAKKSSNAFMYTGNEVRITFS